MLVTGNAASSTNIRFVEHTMVLDVLFSVTKEVVQFVQCLCQVLIMLGHLLHNDYFLLFHTPGQHDLVKKLPLQTEAHHYFEKENRCDRIKTFKYVPP